MDAGEGTGEGADDAAGSGTDGNAVENRGLEKRVACWIEFLALLVVVCWCSPLDCLLLRCLSSKLATPDGS